MALYIIPFPSTQVVYWLGAASGAGLSAYLSSSWGEDVNTEAAWLSFVGGVLLLFGSRLAAGCTRLAGWGTYGAQGEGGGEKHMEWDFITTSFSIGLAVRGRDC